MFPDFLNRLTNAGRAAWAAWNGMALIPTQQAGWEIWSSRQFRYELYNNYYSNNIYSFTDRFNLIQKEAYGLYKNIRPIENPVTRLVELYVAKVYGGALNMQTLATGAIPFVLDDDRILEALKQLLIWSNFGTHKSLYIRHGSLYGDVGLKIVDDRELQQVRMEVLDPRKIKHATFNSVGDVDEIHIEYYAVEERDSKSPGGMPARDMYLYTEIITPDSFATYKNGSLFAYYNDANGTPVAKWKNEYGRVPVVLAQHRNLGLNFGMNAFQPALRKIDEINDQVSLLDDNIRKHVNVLWYMAGVNKSTDLKADTTTRDQLPAVYGPANSKPEAMVAQFDIAAASAQIEHLIEEVERDMPELSLHRLREKGIATAPGVRASYSDAIDRIVEARGNYDDALIRAIKMAIGIGGYNGYKDMEGFALDSLADADIYIAERPVIEDEIPKEQKIQFLITSGAPSSAVWSELGYDDNTVQEWDRLAMRDAAMKAQLAAATQSQYQIPADVTTVTTTGNAAPQLPAPTLDETPKAHGSPLPEDQAMDTSHHTDAFYADLFAQYQQNRAAFK